MTGCSIRNVTRVMIKRGEGESIRYVKAVFLLVKTNEIGWKDATDLKRTLNDRL